MPSHTSSAHAWFSESISSRHNEKADWYIWADAAVNGGPPNNWLSRFGGSAWEWCAARAQYYYHSFLVEQPDLNWRNPQVRAALADVMGFWLGRGVDGFRVDASAVLIKDCLLRDNPPDPHSKGKPPPQRYTPVFTDDRPEALECIEFIRSVVDEHPGTLLCGEVQGKTDRIGHFYGNARPRLHLPLNFALLDSAWDALSLQATIDAYYNVLPDGGWPVWVIGGHDKPRVASKIGQKQMRVLAMLLLTLKGTPFFYMGDEIGRERVLIPSDRVRDPFEKLVPGYGLCRDPERAPMRWDSSPTGGFSTGEPWLPLENDAHRNIEQQQSDESSLLHLFRTLISLRRTHSCLRHGEYQAVRSSNDVLTFKRVSDGGTLLIGLNMSTEPRKWECSHHGRTVMSTDPKRQSESMTSSAILLAGDEGAIIEVDNR